MGVIEDTLKALELIPVWRRLKGVPAEIDGLKSRVGELEEKLGGKWPADVCKYCGERAVRLQSKLGPFDGGKMRESWRCSACNKTEARLV